MPMSGSGACTATWRATFPRRASGLEMPPLHGRPRRACFSSTRTLKRKGTFQSRMSSTLLTHPSSTSLTTTTSSSTECIRWNSEWSSTSGSWRSLLRLATLFSQCEEVGSSLALQWYDLSQLDSSWFLSLPSSYSSLLHRHAILFYA